jgi:hypothetical protein
MTTDQLQQKHLEAIKNKSYQAHIGLMLSGDEDMNAAAKQCAIITLEHTIGVLEEMKFEPTINYSESISIDMANVATKHFNAHIDRKISELKKQKEQV